MLKSLIQRGAPGLVSSSNNYFVFASSFNGDVSLSSILSCSMKGLSRLIRRACRVWASFCTRFVFMEGLLQLPVFYRSWIKIVLVMFDCIDRLFLFSVLCGDNWPSLSGACCSALIVYMNCFVPAQLNSSPPHHRIGFFDDPVCVGCAV